MTAPTELPRLSASMAISDLTEFSASIRKVIELLGVRQSAVRNVSSLVGLHEYLTVGLPSRALLRAMQPLGDLEDELLPIIGISTRTLGRLKAHPEKLLDPEKSGRLWRYAEILTNAGDVLGGVDRAVEWLTKPAMALENRRPIELLTTPVGAKLVSDVIERMRFGVYQ
jgi:putative toxin-antitoxin system antitoxin component (TIGR02293 family)